VVPDPEWAEWVRGPRLQIDSFYSTGAYEGDCDDAATFAASILCSMGIPCSFVAFRFGQDPDFSHVNTEAWPGIQIDPIVPPDQLPIANASEIMVVEVI
jgi:hypothetical protein